MATFNFLGKSDMLILAVNCRHNVEAESLRFLDRLLDEIVAATTTPITTIRRFSNIN